MDARTNRHGTQRLFVAALGVGFGLAGCTGDSWYRAQPWYDGYFIFRAGLDDDSCLLLYVSGFPGELSPVTLWGYTNSAYGSLVFDASEPWINPNDDTPTPCRVSVDISIDFDPLVHWTPTTLRFLGEGIDVAQTCD